MLAAERNATRVARGGTPSLEEPRSWRQLVEPVEPFLQAVAGRLAAQAGEFEPEMAEWVRYALGSQGKQLRPALVALSAEATGASVHDDLVRVAAIVEMVHLATLVHDDVMDVASIRRNQPTLAAECGNSMSVLIGDCLFAHALELAARFPTPDVCRKVASATKSVCAGEILQHQRRGHFALDRREYFRVLRMKTGELFGLSCELGSWLSGAGPEEQAGLRAFGMALGTAYQIYDDCLDLFGSEAKAGKSLGTDLAGGKSTLPVLVALERCEGAERSALERLLAHWEPRHLPPLLQLLERTRALEECREVIEEFCLSGRRTLEVLPPTEGRRALAWVAGFLVRQARGLGGQGA